MTPFVKLLRGLFERAFGRYHEGAEPPERYDDVVSGFATIYPKATRAQWMKFSIDFARQAYCEGFVRGAEHAERMPEEAFSKLPPELEADMLDPEWRQNVPFADAGPIGIPGEEEIPGDPPDAPEQEWRSI